MSINVTVHKNQVSGSYPTKINTVNHFIEINFQDLIKQLNSKEIILDDMTSFFLKDVDSEKIFRLYFADFTKMYSLCAIPTIEEYTGNMFDITISGTIKFK